MKDIGHEEEGPSIIFVDNKGLISNTLSTPKHEANKHLRVQLYYKNELAQESKIKLEYLETKRMLADMMTTQIPGPRSMTSPESYWATNTCQKRMGFRWRGQGRSELRMNKQWQGRRWRREK